MCHRKLFFTKSTTCGHLTFTGEQYVDCGESNCALSRAHPANCGSPTQPCTCRRYY
ncbi:hypothetical protein NEOLEDRAFT_1052433, partial [Neolentinus lepideus HHB14362 ss-1]